MECCSCWHSGLNLKRRRNLAMIHNTLAGVVEVLLQDDDDMDAADVEEA